MKKDWFVPLLLAVSIFATISVSDFRHDTSRAKVTKIVGKEVPRFGLPPAIAVRPGLGSGSFYEGRPKLLNFFASWCVPCREEMRVLMKLAHMGVSIDGIAVRDDTDEVARLIRRDGNPFQRLGSDVNGRVQSAFGATGVPESFVIDGHGVVRYRHFGVLEVEDVPEILEALRRAQ